MALTAPDAEGTSAGSLAERMLPELSGRLSVPTYDRAGLTPAIVHFGVGGFHRAHQAVYLDDLAERGISTDWGVVGISLRRRDIKEALDPQDRLFTVVERGAEGDEARVIGCLTRVLYAPESPAAVLHALTRPETRLVTLTITGDGYHIDPETLEPLDHEELVADLAAPRRPRTAIGYLVEALQRRRLADRDPFTVLSCDNLPANGATTRRAVLSFAERRDPALAAWIAREVAFPSCVVDRITPECSDATRELVTDAFGILDQAAVVAEPFSQWIIEDDFPGGRPPLDAVGARFVEDVEPYERMKKRLLNGSHSALGYVGYLLGYRQTDEAMGDPLVRAYIERLMRDEVGPLVPPVPGIDLREYRDGLLERFSNPRIGDDLSRLCGRGSTKVPAYLLPSIAEARRLGRPHELLNIAVAAWVRYLRGIDLEGFVIPIRDARRDELHALAVQGGDDPAPVMAASRVFGWLAQDPLLVGAIRRILEQFADRGLRGTLEAYVAAGDLAAS
jgi:fructuronate reductase/mannitol 2-dehydrogenase